MRAVAAWLCARPGGLWFSLSISFGPPRTCSDLALGSGFQIPDPSPPKYPDYQVLSFEVPTKEPTDGPVECPTR
jgi:hypothetical protein